LRSFNKKYRGAGLEVVVCRFEEGEQFERPGAVTGVCEAYGIEYPDTALAGELPS